MLVKMAKMAKQKKPIASAPKKVEVPKVAKKPSYFPKIRALFGVVLVAVAVIDYFNFYSLSRQNFNILLFLAGIYLIYLAFTSSLAKKRKEFAKKFI